MTLDVAYSYCINLTEEEKLEIDKQVRKNRSEVKLAIFLFPTLFPWWPAPTLPNPPVYPGEVFSPHHIVRKARDQVASAAAKKVAPLTEAADDCKEAYNEYKVYKEMSSTLSKVSTKVRKDKETTKSLDKLEEQLKNG